MKKVLVIGSLNMDFVVNITKNPLPGETIMAEKFSLVPGGKGANQAYALGKLGVNTSILGAVGKDNYGETLINNLKNVNVNVENVEKIDESTGIALVSVDKSGQNSIIVIGGANKKITKEMIDKNINLIIDSDIIVLQLEIPLDVVIYITEVAKKYDKYVVLDPAPAIPNLPISLLKNIDIIKPNEIELQVVSGIKTESEEDIYKAAKSLISNGVKNVVVTLGEKGSILINDKIKKIPSLKIGEVVDTTGAGDSFNAGLIKGLLDGKELETALEFATVVASIVVTKHGATSSIPTIDEIEEVIKGKI